MITSSYEGSEVISFAVAALVVIGVFAIPLELKHKRHERSAGATVEAPAPPTPHAELRAPHANDALQLDGELDEPSWKTSARTGAFLAESGVEATPFSEARFVWTDDTLRVGLYAADEDIVTAYVPADGPVWRGDAFHLVITTAGVEHVFDVGPTCVLTDGERRNGGSVDYRWQSDAKLACDADGTIDTAGDQDEEWVVEMAIPLAKLGLKGSAGEQADVRIRRCDARGGQPISNQRCGELKAATIVFAY